MKRYATVLLLVGVMGLAQFGHAQAQASPDFAKKVEAYMRELFAWGPNIILKIGAPTASAMPGLLEVKLEVTLNGQTNTGSVFASPDGKFIVRGEVHDTSADPFAVNRTRMNTQNAPSKGPSDAKVTIVEFADFQCSSCKQMHDILEKMLPRYPQIRFVFKDLPLVQIHPWAMTAATAGRCAYQQKPAAFWSVHDDFFHNQTLIKAADVWDRSLAFATKAGLDEAAFRACMASPEAKAAVESSMAEARALNIANTPTTFINGRRLVGPDAELLEQYVRYELAKAQSGGATPATDPAKRP